MPASGTDFQNTGFLPAFTKLAVKYRPGRWNTGRLASLVIGEYFISHENSGHALQKEDVW